MVEVCKEEVSGNGLMAVAKAKLEVRKKAAFNLPDEQARVLLADATNMQALLTLAQTVSDAAEKSLGRAITTHAEFGLDAFHNGLLDLISELQSTYDVVDQELDGREAVKDREHEKIESANTVGMAAE